MTAALRTATPTITLPDPVLSPLEREILDTHPVELMIRATDIENECEHENLPFDPDPDCECWTRERTAALLGQAPLDDGCPGLDQAAAFDLPVPQIEVPGQAPDLQPALDEPDVAAIHAWYLRDEHTLGLTAEKFGLTRARLNELFAAHDLPVKNAKRGWQVRSRHIFGRADHNQEERMHTSHNGAAPTTEPTIEAIHEWYMAESDRTLSDVQEQFGLSAYAVKSRFEAADLSCKPRGGNRRAATPVSPTAPPEIQQPDPETPIEGIAAAIVALERERDAAVVRGLRCEAAIDTLRELAA